MQDIFSFEPDEKTKAEIVSKCTEDKNMGEADTTTLRNTGVEMWQLYNNFRSTKGRISKIISGLPFAFTENALASLFKELISVDQYSLVDVQPANSKTPIENAFRMKVLINNQLYKSGFIRSMLDFVTQSLVVGYSPAKVVPSVKKNFLLEDYMDEKGDMRKREVGKDIKHPDFIPIDIFNLYPAPLPYSHSVEDMEYMITESWLPKSYFQQRKNVFFDTDKIENDSETNELAGYKGGKENQGIAKRVRYWERWGLYEYNGEVREYIMGIANKNQVIRFGRNPYNHQRKPFVMAQNFPIPFTPYGRGEFEPIKNSIYQVEDLTNSVMDNVANLVHSMWTVIEGTNLAQEERIYSDAGKIFVVGAHNDIAPMQQSKNDISQSASWMISYLQSQAQFTLGIGDYGMGATPKRKEAVGTVLAIQRAIATKYAKKMYLMIQVIGQQVAQFYSDYNQQYYNSDEEYLFKGGLPKGIDINSKEISEGLYATNIDKEGITGDFIFTFNVDPQRLQEEVIRQQLQTLYMFLVKNQVAGVRTDQLLKQIFYTYPVRNLDKVIGNVTYSPNELVEVLQLLTESGYQILDPKGRPLGQSQTGQGGGRPSEELNPNKLPRATDAVRMNQGVNQLGQSNPGVQNR